LKETKAEEKFWFQALISVGVMALISLVLFILGVLVKKEYRFNENWGRNYLPNAFTEG